MATIRQRGTKWQCIIKRTGYPTQAKTFDLKKDAEKWGRQEEQRIDSAQWVGRTESQRTTLGELLDRYAKKISPTKRGGRQKLSKLTSINRHSISKHSASNISSKLIVAAGCKLKQCAD